MAGKRGILMEIKGRKGIVLTEDGAFLETRLGHSHYRVGDEIAVLPPGLGRPGLTRPWAAAVVAAVVLFLVVAGLWGPFAPSNQVYAYVSVDINPSVELGVDRSGRVLEATAIDPEGVRLLGRVEINRRPLDEVVADLTRAAEQEGLLASSAERPATVLITTVPASGHSLSGDVEQAVVRAEETVRAQLAEISPVTQVERLNIADSEVRQAARNLDVSAGTYVLWLEALDSLTDSTPLPEDTGAKGPDANGTNFNPADLKPGDLNPAKLAALLADQELTPADLVSRARADEGWRELFEEWKEAAKERDRDEDDDDDDDRGKGRRDDDDEDEDDDDRGKGRRDDDADDDDRNEASRSERPGPANNGKPSWVGNDDDDRDDRDQPGLGPGREDPAELGKDAKDHKNGNKGRGNDKKEDRNDRRRKPPGRDRDDFDERDDRDEDDRDEDDWDEGDRDDDDRDEDND